VPVFPAGFAGPDVAPGDSGAGDFIIKLEMSNSMHTAAAMLSKQAEITRLGVSDKSVT
jgi:hypothetical protein